MSTHPNTILLLVLTPEDLARKTMKNILAENNCDEDGDLKINGEDYHHEIMEDDYEEDYQISAEEGDLLFFDLVTYGYGEKILWEKLEKQKNDLEAWAKSMCEKYHCTYKIYVTANYW